MMTVYIPKHEGGRGMIQLELSYKTWTIGQNKYNINRLDATTSCCT